MSAPPKAAEKKGEVNELLTLLRAVNGSKEAAATVTKKKRDVLKKVGKTSKQLNCTPSPDGSGEIYAAVNPVMPHLFKMGFTFKDAETRVKALQTAGVLEPFELVRHAAVPDAR